jgi:prepilin-type N-terminal cleavage/methylation domain-containing protein
MRASGFSLVEVIVAIAVLGFISTGLVKMLASSSKSARSTERLVDLKFLARTFSENVECHRTLKSDPVGTAGFSPLSCNDFPMGSVTLRRKDNSKFQVNAGDKLGGFEIQAGCRNRRLHI